MLGYELLLITIKLYVTGFSNEINPGISKLFAVVGQVFILDRVFNELPQDY